MIVFPVHRPWFDPRRFVRQGPETVSKKRQTLQLRASASLLLYISLSKLLAQTYSGWRNQQMTTEPNRLLPFPLALQNMVMETASQEPSTNAKHTPSSGKNPYGPFFGWAGDR
jgi:hypothetical protein